MADPVGPESMISGTISQLALDEMPPHKIPSDKRNFFFVGKVQMTFHLPFLASDMLGGI